MMLVRGRSQARDSAQGISVSRDSLAARYTAVRRVSEALSRPLAPDDYGLQAMPDVSPAKWHLAHTSWFFETFLLKAFVPGYRPFHPQFEHLFNSYYDQVGVPFARASRGLLSRPTVEEVFRYRAQVDEAMAALLATVEEQHWPEVAARATLGCHHEEQHQELFLTDIKYNFAVNPLKPAYRDDLPAAPAGAGTALNWIEQAGGTMEIGHDGAGFAFDNEGPRHRSLAHAVCARLAPGHQWRVSRVHQGRRLCATRILAGGRFSHRARASAGRHRCTGKNRTGAGSCSRSRARGR